MAPFQRLTDADLRSLAAALRSGRLSPPFALAGVGRIVPGPLAADVAASMQALAAEGMRPGHLAGVAEAILATRAGRPVPDDAVELVWTGPEAEGVVNRDTAVVVRELFAQASESVVVAGFAVHQGRDVFRGLAERLAARVGMSVRLYLDVRRESNTAAPEADAVRRFARRFSDHEWPGGCPLPEVYYDPRALRAELTKRACLHAKCVVIDRRVAFVTSANFTEAAHERNIEAGVIVRSARFANRLADHFDSLAAAGTLERLDLASGRAT